MKPIAPKAAANGSRPARRAFTLVELMVSVTIGMLVLAAMCSIFIMSVKLVNKNQQIATAVLNTRNVQEHLNAELARAISQTTPVDIRPKFSNSSGTTPPRFSAMSYRIPIGSYAQVSSDTAITNSTIQVSCPADVNIEVGDYFMMDSPNLGSGIRITNRSPSTNSGPSTTVTLTLATTLAAAKSATDSSTTAQTGKLVFIQRERKYEAVLPATGGTVTELRWYENTYSSSYIVLSSRVDANAAYMFSQIPADTSSTVLAPESSVSWRFSYLSSGWETYAQGRESNSTKAKDFYQGNYAEGLIMPKSGNPLASASYMGGPPSTLGTSTTNNSSTSSSQTTTFESSTSSSRSSTSTSQSSTSLTSSSRSSTSLTSSSRSSTSSSQSSTSSSRSSTSLTSSSRSSTSSSQSSTSSSQSSTSSSRSSTSLTSSSRSSTSSSQSSTSSSRSSTSLTSSSRSSTSSSQSSTSSSRSSTSTSQSSTSLTSSSRSSTSLTSTSQSSTSLTSTSKSSTSTSKSSTTTTIPFDG